MNMEEVEKTVMAVTGISADKLFDMAVLGELEEKSELDTAIEKVNKMIAVQSQKDRTFTVSGPTTMFVRKSNGSYGQESFIGGEELLLTGAIIGKRKVINYVFKPIAASPFEAVEINDAKAKENLDGFVRWASRNGRTYTEMIREAKRAANKEAENCEAPIKKETYGEEWGNW